MCRMCILSNAKVAGFIARSVNGIRHFMPCRGNGRPGGVSHTAAPSLWHCLHCNVWEGTKLTPLHVRSFLCQGSRTADDHVAAACAEPPDRSWQVLPGQQGSKADMCLLSFRQGASSIVIQNLSPSAMLQALQLSCWRQAHTVASHIRLVCTCYAAVYLRHHMAICNFWAKAPGPTEGRWG